MEQINLVLLLIRTTLKRSAHLGGPMWY